MHKNCYRSRTGFTFIELMIIVAVIAILAAIAIPNLLRARLESNETATIQNLHSIQSAQGAFNAAAGKFAMDMLELTDVTPAFLDRDFRSGVLAGYVFAFGGTEYNYTINANPATWGLSGVHGYFTDAGGVIRYNEGAPADSTSPPLQ